MARERKDLDKILREILGQHKLYFSPPNGMKMTYPCIVYELSNTDVQHADNKPFITFDRYTITVIDRSPDSKIRDAVLHTLDRVSLDRSFTLDNLNHYVFTLYF